MPVFGETPWDTIDETWDQIAATWGAIDVSGNALLGWTNRIAAGALSAGSETTAAPVANLADDQGASAWQTAGALTSWFQVDAGAPVTWRAMGIFRTNLTTAATVRWKLGTTAGAADVADSLAQSGIVAGYNQLTYEFGQDYTARYLRIEITDLANPDGFLKVGLAYGGPMFQPTRNFSYGAAIGRESEVAEVVSRGGQEFPTHNWSRRAWDLAFDFLSEDEAYQQVLELDRVARFGGNVLIIPRPGSPYQQRAALFGRLKNVAAIVVANAAVFSYRFRLTERL